jgi:hypothetical protein
VGFLGGNGLPTDTGPDASPVTTPDQKALGKSKAQGNIEGGWAGHFWQVLFSALAEGMKAVITAFVGVFDELLSFFVQFVTAAQGTKTQGFYDLTAAIINDLLGVEVAGSEIAQAGTQRGLIGAMQKAGGDFFNVLANEFLGQPPSAAGGPSGLPGTPGAPLTPQQGVDSAKAFLGFILSFAVRQGNLETIATALPESFRMFDGIRAYGELMAKNLGLGRMSRRALQPLIQTLIATPLQQALNQQYRPHVMDAKQLASAFIRGDIDRSDYAKRLTLLGFTDSDIDLLISDTYTRLRLEDVFLLHENGIVTDDDLNKRVAALGFNSFDTPLLLQARMFESIAGVQREYVKAAISDLQHGVIAQSVFESDVDSTNLPKEEKRWYKILGENRANGRRKQLSLGFLKRAYLDASITLDEYLAHALALGYSQDDVDIMEVELLFEQKKQAALAAAKAAAAAKKAAGKSTTSTAPASSTPSTPPKP